MYVCFPYYHRKTLRNKGIILKTKYFGGLLPPRKLFRDDLWWRNVQPEIENIIEVKPNPMVIKAEEIFRDALKK
jgi:hypothetical protein